MALEFEVGSALRPLWSPTILWAAPLLTVGVGGEFYDSPPPNHHPNPTRGELDESPPTLLFSWDEWLALLF